MTESQLGAHQLNAGFFGDTAVFVGVDGRISLINHDTVQWQAHGTGLLVAVIADDCVFSGGEDGRVVRTAQDGSTMVLGDQKGSWIDAIAASPDGSVAWSTGKTVYARSAKGEIKVMTAPTTARGLAFLPKGYRLAIAHYNGTGVYP